MEVSEKLTKKIEEVKYLSVENTERYRPIMRYFFKQYEKLEYWLYKEEVFNNLKDNPEFEDYTLELCEQDLLKLTEWGNLTYLQDTSNVKTLEEYKNRKFRYQLTEYAVEIERMVIRLETLKVEKASLEPKAFEELKNLLEKVQKLDSIEEINNCFEKLNETFTKLNNNYRDFLKMFSETKNEELMKIEQFLIFKDKVIEYLKNYMSSFQINEIKIKKILDNLPDDFEELLISKVMEYKKRQPILDPDFDFKYLEEINRGKWNSIVKWFNNSKYEESESERLKKAINSVISKITKYAISIMENTSNTNRMEEYKHILKLFFKTKTLEQAQQLSMVTFGITEVKHFTNIEKTTDSINTNPKDSIPSFIELKSHSRIIREKVIKQQVDDKFFEKEMQLKKILDEKNRKEQLLKKYIKNGEIVIKDLKGIEPFERRFILSLLDKGMNKQIYKNSEFGIEYIIEKIDDSKIQLNSIDGNLTMNNIKIKFLGDKNGF